MQALGRHGNKENRNLGRVFFTIVLLVLVGLFFSFLIPTNKPDRAPAGMISKNIETISDYNYSSVDKVAEQLRVIDSQGAWGTNYAAASGNAVYRAMFEDCVVLGDSITEGLTVYGFLNEGQVFAQIGGTVASSETLFQKAAATHPRTAFLSFGTNDMGSFTSNSQLFIKAYEKQIKNFLKESPKTQICINSINKPTDEFVARKPNFRYADKYNKALKTMCKKLGVLYIDNSFILEEQPELREGDGVHVSARYYLLWMSNMTGEAAEHEE